MPLLIAALLAVAALASTSTPAAAQPTAWHQEDAEHGGRIAELYGRLRVQRASGDTFELSDGPRTRQMAIREGDRLVTSWNSRLVIAIGPNRVKLDEKTELLVRRLERDGVELDLERGGVVLELRIGESAWRWQVDTAAGRHQPHGAGLFRIDAPDRRGPDTGSATAWRSALRIENEDGTLLLPPGRRAERDRNGRWEIGFPQADAFAAWAMTPPAENLPPEDWGDRGDRRPRQWRSAPSWDLPPPPPMPPRVIVVPAPIVIEPPPRVWRSQPEPRDQRPPRWAAPPQAPMPVPPPDIAVPPPRPDRRHHEVAPQPPMAPAMPAPSASSPSQPRQDEPRRSQRAL